MRRLSLYVLLLALICAVPLFAQEATPDVAPTEEAMMQSDATPAGEATAEATAEPSGVRVPTAHIRIAHLSIDTPPIQIYINGELSDIQTIAYPDITGWVEVPVGTYNISAVPLDESLEQAVLGPLELSFARGAWITIAAVGSFENGTLSAELIAESYGQIPLNQARLTVYHALAGGEAVDVVVNDSTIPVQGLEYSGVFIADVPAEASNVQVVASGTDTVVVDLGELDLNAGSFYFIGVTGTTDAPQVVMAEVQSGLVASFLDDVDGTIIETLEADGRFTTLLSAIEAAGLTETLSGEGPFTIFAPVDAAFAALPADDLDALLGDADALSDLLQYHVVEGSLTSDDVLAATSLTTLQGSDVTVSLNEQGAFLNDSAQIIIVDVPATNGVIHAINTVLMPMSGGESDSDMDMMEMTPEATQEG